MVNPAIPKSYTFKTAKLSNGLTYRYIDQAPESDGPGSGRTVICFHGFPDLSIGWRYQIAALVKRGFRVIAPDQIGYGGTDKPEDPKYYTYGSSANAMHELVAVAGVKGKPIVLGHDWGAQVAWRYLMLFPNEVECMVNVCVPPTKPTQPGQPFISLEKLVRDFLPNFGYQLYFASEEAVPQIEADLKFFLSPMFSPKTRSIVAGKKEKKGGDQAAMDDEWVKEGGLKGRVAKAGGKFEGVEVDEEEFAFYMDTFKKGGMRGPLTWYRTRQANYDEETSNPLPTTWTAHVPALLIAPTNDPALPLSMSSEKTLKSCFPGGNLEKVVVEGDHWLLQSEEARDEVTKVIVDWVEKQVQRGGRQSRL